MQPGRSTQSKGLIRLVTPEVDRLARRMHRVFESLQALPYLGPEDLRDFHYYRSLFDRALADMDRKASEGRLRPLDLRGFPQDLRYPGYAARLGIFIGSFDPFQMTHLAMALRFLSADSSEADALIVVPEGSADPRKPNKTEYSFRYEILKRQLAGVFDPFVVPLDIGSGADTIEIVRRLIALHPGASLRLTHVMGSDTLPLALRLLPDDLEAWRDAAARSRVSLDFSIFVVRRDRRAPLRPLVEAVRRLGVRVVLDRDTIGTPSSTAFRSERAITLVFPTEAVLSRLELLFRYSMNRPWTPGGEGAPPMSPTATPGVPPALASMIGGTQPVQTLAPCGRPPGSCGGPCTLLSRSAGEVPPEAEPDFQI